MISIKKNTAAFLAAMVMVITFSQAKAFILEGFTKGIGNGKVELSIYNLRTKISKSLGVTTVKNGKFLIKGILLEPTLVNLNFIPGNWGTQVFLENKPMKITIDTTGAQYYDFSKFGSIKGATLKKVSLIGSASQKDFQDYRAVYSGINSRESILEKQLVYIRKYIKDKPEMPVGAYILNEHYIFNPELSLKTVEELLSEFKGVARKSVYFKELETEWEAKKNVSPGHFAEDFTLMKPDSSKFTLSSLRGKYVLLDFWASWCKPCREAIPHWKDVYAKYRNNGLEIVSVTTDTKWTSWKKALAEEAMPWIQVADEFEGKDSQARVFSTYRFGSIPLYVLLDKEGKILVKSTDKHEVDVKLTELFEY